MTKVAPHFDGIAKFSPIGHTYSPGKKFPFRWWRIPIWRVELNLDFPLCFVRADGIKYRPDMVFTSDGGSIPYTVQNVASMVPGINLKRDVYPKSYAIHDSGYKNKGLWVWHPDGKWIFQTMDRGTVDLILMECLLAEGANMAERNLIYAGVRAGGWVPWDRQRLS